jgi:threonine dehydratase
MGMSTLHLFTHHTGLGFVTETSGCAAVAALRSGKIANVQGLKVACVVSGSNIRPTELQEECFDAHHAHHA